MKRLSQLFSDNLPYNASQDEVIELTNQFYVTLRAYFARIKSSGTIRNQDAFNRVEHILKPDNGQNWTNAYEVEQLLIQLYDDETLATELSVRILEARSVLRPELAAIYDAEFNETRDPQAAANPKAVIERRRALLARLVNDLQWRYIVNEATRRYSKVITRRTAYLFVGSLILFSVLVVVIFRLPLEFTSGDLRLLGVAGLAGAWGAAFSMLATLKSRLDASKFDDLKLMRVRAVLFSRALIGAGAACILFFFLLSGLLGGTAFPILIHADDAAAILPRRDLALLIVWCFIAGFSEQLIPGLLASTEARANSAVASASDRFRPTTGTAEIPSPDDSTKPRKPEALNPVT